MPWFLSEKCSIKLYIKITLYICIQMHAYKNYKELKYAYRLFLFSNFFIVFHFLKDILFYNQKKYWSKKLKRNVRAQNADTYNLIQLAVGKISVTILYLFNDLINKSYWCNNFD